MSIFEKIDMGRHRRDINLCKPVSQPDATGYSGVEPGAIEVIPSVSFADNSGEDSIPGRPEPIVKPTGRIVAQEPAISKDKEA